MSVTSAQWQREKGPASGITHVLRDRATGVALAHVYSTGSRLTTNRWHWQLPGGQLPTAPAGSKGDASSLEVAKRDAERAAL